MPNKIELVKNYERLVKASICEIESGYFTVANRFRNEPNISERVFCYEFYYNLRKLIEESVLDLKKGRIFFHGELNKSKYETYGKITPDFLIHDPDNGDSNLITIEIKPKLDIFIKDSKPYGIYKDFLSLCNMIEKNYQLGIFILFNHTYEEFVEHYRKYLYQICDVHKRDFKEHSSSIKLLIKATAESELLEKSFEDFLDDVELRS